MDTLKSCLLLLLFLLSAVVGWVIILDLTTQYALLNIHYYSREIDRHKLNELPKNNLILKLKTNSMGAVPEPITGALSNALDKTFTPEWTKSQTNSVLLNLFNYIKGKSDRSDFSINLTSRKDLLEKNLTNELRKLSPDEISSYNSINKDPQYLSHEIITIMNIPDSLDAGGFLQDPKIYAAVMQLQKFYYFMIIMPYIILGCIFILMRRITSSHHSSFKWFGNSMIVAAVLSVAAILAINGHIEAFMVKSISNQTVPLAGTDGSPLLLAAVYKNDIAVFISIMAAVYGTLGVIITFIGDYFEKRHNREPYLPG